MPRGELYVYLGAAPGVGQTVAMLEEGRRRQQQGADVVAAPMETHGRQDTSALAAGFEPARPRPNGRTPDVVLVDELATPGRRHEVEAYRDAGVTVLTTLNVQHLESLGDAVEQITGARPGATVPDALIRGADHVELVDLSAEALRERRTAGHVYDDDQLTALRELAKHWLAGGRERVAVALTGGPEGETLIRRAARIAARSTGAELLAVHVVRNDGLADANPANLARQRVLVESLGGSYHQILGNDIPAALLAFARRMHATQLVLGASRRGHVARLFAPGVATTAARSGAVDVHLVTHEEVSRGGVRPAWGRALTRRRRFLGLATVVVGLPALTDALSLVRAELTFPSDVLVFLAAVVGIALLGGLYPALVAAVGGFLLLNYYFTPPLHELTVDRPENVLGLIVFLVVGTAVSVVVELAARRTAEASSARAEAATLSTVAGSVLRGGHPLTALLDQLRETFGLSSVTLLEKLVGRPTDSPTGWRIAASVGDRPATSPADGDAAVPIGDELILVPAGRPLGPADRRVLEAFAAQAALALRQQRLAAQAATADKISAADRLRSALLSAVSHDLRTPLAAAKAAVTSLRSADVAFDPADREELLATADESLDRLIGLVENLLDMSRLQAGVLGVHPQPIDVAEVLPRVIGDVGESRVAYGCRRGLPEVR